MAAWDSNPKGERPGPRPANLDDGWKAKLEEANRKAQELIALVARGEQPSAESYNMCMALFNMAGNLLADAYYEKDSATGNLRLKRGVLKDDFDSALLQITSARDSAKKQLSAPEGVNPEEAGYATREGMALEVLRKHELWNSQRSEQSMRDELAALAANRDFNSIHEIRNAALVLEGSSNKEYGALAKRIREACDAFYKDYEEEYSGKKGFPITGWGKVDSAYEGAESALRALNMTSSSIASPPTSGAEGGNNVIDRAVSPEALGNALYGWGNFYYRALNKGVLAFGSYFTNSRDRVNWPLRLNEGMLRDARDKETFSELKESLGNARRMYTGLVAHLNKAEEMNGEYSDLARMFYFSNEPFWEKPNDITYWKNERKSMEERKQREGIAEAARQISGGGSSAVSQGQGGESLMSDMIGTTTLAPSNEWDSYR